MSACPKLEQEKPAIFAKIDDIKRTFHAQSLSVYQEYYWRGSQGTKSTDREKLIRQAADLKNITSRLLAFLFALCRQGFDGTLCPLDVISERLKKATGGKGEPRTIRRALITLEQLGWIHRAYHRTGAQIMTPKGLLNLQVLRVTFCPSIYQALGFVSIPTEHRPKRPLHPNTKARQEETIGRFLPADALTMGQTEEKEKGDRLDGVQLAPALAVAHTSVLLKTSAAKTEETQDSCQSQLAVITREEQAEEKTLGTTKEFLACFLSAVKDQIFARKLFMDEKGVIICELLEMARNQHDPRYSDKFPRVQVDFMEWALAPWPEQRKIIEKYIAGLQEIARAEGIDEQLKKIFFNSKPLNYIVSRNIAFLMVMGKIKISDLNEKYLEDLNV